MAGDKTDIVVVGAGIFGLWCAHAALRRGLSVRVLEADGIGAGASGGLVGALAPHMPERWGPKKQYQLEALLALGPALRAVEAESGMPTGYDRTGRIVPLGSDTARTRALERIVEARENWGDAAQMAVLPGDAYPRWLMPEAAPHGIVHDTLTGRLDPLATCRALAEAIRRGGAVIETGVTVGAVGTGHVETSHGVREGAAIIVAAGVAGFDLIAPHVGEVAGRAEKGQAALLDLDLGDVPLIYADGLYLIAHRHGGVAVGATSERRFDATGPDELLDDVIRRARLICPRLARRPVLKRWAGLRPRANGRDPMLGPIPGVEGVHAALGAFKIGFGIGHRVGEDVVAGIVDGPVEMPESFRVPAHLGL